MYEIIITIFLIGIGMACGMGYNESKHSPCDSIVYSKQVTKGK